MAKIYLWVPILALAMAVIAKAEPDTTSPTKTFLEALRHQHMENVFCGPKSPYRQCLIGSQSECTKSVTKYLEECLNKIAKSMPEKLSNQEALDWTQRIGMCAVKNHFAEMNKAGKVAGKAECRKIATLGASD